MSCVSISVLTDNIFYLISFEGSAFRRGSNLFPLVCRIAEIKGFKSILKLLSKNPQKSWLKLIFASIYFCELKKNRNSPVLILENGRFSKILRVFIFANGKFLKILSLQISAPRKKE